MNHNYFIYILTNVKKNVLYTGVTNDLAARLYEHKMDSLNAKKTFAGKYNCIYLVYYERFQYIEHAIEREKEIKGWKREKKIRLIESLNPKWDSLNAQVD
jgi:putative endonuclease